MTGQPSVAGSVLVVGSINVDLVASVPMLPTRGETVVGGSFAQHQGGKGANQAVAAARIGARVSFIGAVGNDDLGRSALEALAAESVDTAGITILPNVTTGVALIQVDLFGQNQIAVASGANAEVGGQLVARALSTRAAGAGVFVACFEISDEAVVVGARLAAERGMTLIINPAPARALPGELTALRPIVVPNEVEAEALTGERDPAAAGRLLAGRTGNAAIVTCGARGAVVVNGSDIQWLPAPYAEVIDTTGAGDCFVGALAAELANGAALLDAARVAVRAASISVTARGARAGMPTRAQLR